MSIKPKDIMAIMDVAKQARANGDNFIPCIRSEAGLGKSQIIHQWAKANEYQMIDLRFAMLEAPDLLGFPIVIELEDGTSITKHCTPSFWARDPNSKGVLFLDELNRGDTSVTNAGMQLLTDRKVGEDYTLPEGWLIVTAINGDDYDVNTMDAALADRVAIFDMAYNKKDFLDYMKARGFSESIQSYVKSGNWDYKTPSELGEDGTYVSPRSWERLNVFMKTNHSQDLFFKTAVSILGKGVGREFYAFCTNDRPLYADDFKGTKKQIAESINKLKGFVKGEGKERRSDLMEVTLSSVLEHVKEHKEKSHITRDIAINVALSVPADLSVEFLKAYVYNLNADVDPDAFPDFTEFFKDRPEVMKYLKERIKGNK